MGTKSYLLGVPRTNDGLSTRPDLEAMTQRMDELLNQIDARGETVIAVQGLDAGWGNTFQNVASGQRTYGAGLGFTFTDALLVITRSEH